MRKIATVSSVNRKDWELLTEDGKYVRAFINRLYKGGSLPIVGDKVEYETDEYNNNFIISKEKRNNMLKRFYNGQEQKIASNIDIVFIVSSMNKEFSLEKLERFAILGKVDKARICFILTKKDLAPNYLDYEIQIYNRFPNANVISVNALDVNEVNSIKNLWSPGETAIFIGASGVGKSTIINSLLNKEVMKTGAIRESDSKGRHTTTARHLLLDEDGRIIIDTPGIRAVQITNDNFGAKDVFENIAELEKKCYYSDCSHKKNEKGCAVWEAIRKGKLKREDYERYLKLKKKEFNKSMHEGSGPKMTRYEKEQFGKQRKKEHNKGGRGR